MIRTIPRSTSPPWEPKTDRNADVSGWCLTEQHDRCDGILRAATGYHWWCACPQHDPIPEPAAKDFEGKPIAFDDHRKAWAVWQAARKKIPSPV